MDAEEKKLYEDYKKGLDENIKLIEDEVERILDDHFANKKMNWYHL